MWKKKSSKNTNIIFGRKRYFRKKCIWSKSTYKIMFGEKPKSTPESQKYDSHQTPFFK
jgi:hypothetical protein